jgi:hypothetical protein
MSTATTTLSSTYSTVDVGKVVDQFTADFHMLGAATGLASPQRAADVGHDIKLMAKRDYIDRVDIVLLNAAGKEIRAAKYTVSTDAGLWSPQRPGDNLWPRQVGGSLSVVVSYTSTWYELSVEARRRFHNEECRRAWGPSSIDTTYPGLVGRFDRRYASNAYGMERTLYGESGE